MLRHKQFVRVHFSITFLHLRRAAVNLRWSMKGVFLWRELSEIMVGVIAASQRRRCKAQRRAEGLRCF